ncbi:hypothetical protein D050_4888A, partial [Vibrio parahaemolyticus VPCR-2009]
MIRIKINNKVGDIAFKISNLQTKLLSVI